MTEFEETFSILNPIIFGKTWEEQTAQFSLEDLHLALEKTNAIKRVAVCVTIKDYLSSLVNAKIVIHVRDGIYRKNVDFCVNNFCD